MLTIDHSLLPKIGSASLPAKYEAALAALLECDRVDECKKWADQSQALASYAKQSKNKELENMAMRIRARAIRRCGELLQQFVKQQGGDRKSKGRHRPFDRKQAAQDASLSPRQSKTALRIANLSQESFESQIESEQPPTISKLAEQGKIKLNGVPIYVQLNMTKTAFQAGMYFRGDLASYVKALDRHEPQDVIDGSSPEQRETIKRHLQLIEKYHDQLKAQL